jgi:hypothetical protein
MFSLLISLLCRQSISVSLKMCVNLVQFTRSDAFCRSVKQAHNFSFISKVRSDILSIPVASLVSFPLLNPDWSPSTSSFFLSVLLLSILPAIFSVWIYNSTTKFIQDWYLKIVTELIYENNKLKTGYDVKSDAIYSWRTKRNVFYRRSQCLPSSKHSSSRLKTNQLIK